MNGFVAALLALGFVLPPAAAWWYLWVRRDQGARHYYVTPESARLRAVVLAALGVLGAIILIAKELS